MKINVTPLKNIFCCAVWLGFASVAVGKVNPDALYYESCYKPRAALTPSKSEREFLDSYLEYLKVDSQKNSKTVIEKIKALAKDQGGRFSTQWVSIFEGAIELCCNHPPTCTDSFGSTSLKVLYPKVKQGNQSAIDIVLMYKRFVKSDGAESEGLQEYLDLINKKHSKVVKKFERTYKE